MCFQHGSKIALSCNFKYTWLPTKIFFYFSNVPPRHFFQHASKPTLHASSEMTILEPHWRYIEVVVKKLPSQYTAVIRPRDTLDWNYLGTTQIGGTSGNLQFQRGVDFYPLAVHMSIPHFTPELQMSIVILPLSLKCPSCDNFKCF